MHKYMMITDFAQMISPFTGITYTVKDYFSCHYYHQLKVMGKTQILITNFKSNGYYRGTH